MKRGLWIAFGVLATSAAHAQDISTCSFLPTVEERAACLVSAREGQRWQTDTGKSAIDDSPSAVIGVNADTPHRNRYGRYEYPQFRIYCIENKTSLFFDFAGEFMSDIENYGVITYRVDERPAKKKRLSAANDHSGLGTWNGGEAIAFVRDLVGGEKLVVRALPYSESQVEATFTIKGIEEAIEPVQKACGWSIKAPAASAAPKPKAAKGLY